METEKGVVIVKRSSNIAAEVLCSLIALKLGISTPRVSTSYETNSLPLVRLGFCPQTAKKEPSYWA